MRMNWFSGAVVALVLTASCSQMMRGQQDPHAGVPEWFIYSGFFQQVTVWQSFAASEASRGIQNGPNARHFQTEAGLTPSEDETLKSIVRDYQDASTPLWNKRSALTAPYIPRTPTAPFGKLPEAVKLQIDALDDQLRQVQTTHIQQLKTSFGPVRFAVLDTYVRRSSRAKASPSKKK